MIVEPAPAKLNLALHVVGRREDGLHLLESPVAFTAFGDEVAVEPAERDVLTVEGGAVEGPNIVEAARDALRARAPGSGPVAIRLTKRIPVAAGLGGGSADAGATLRALRTLWRLALGDDELAAIGAPLGADVPMCALARVAIARGVGERLVPVAGGVAALGLGAAGVVLVNPRVAMRTPDVFARLERADNDALPALGDDTLAWLTACRNDLETPARALAPVIDEVLAALRDAPLARMSGSGATCFALADDAAAADALAARVGAAHPNWFVASTRLLDRPAFTEQP